MKIYHYDSDTKEYAGSSEAKLDPLELELNKKEIYMLPANATFDMPPESKVGKMVIRTNEKWTQVDIPKPEPILEPIPPTKEELETQEKETLVQAKIRELAITALKAEGKMTADGKVKK